MPKKGKDKNIFSKHGPKRWHVVKFMELFIRPFAKIVYNVDQDRAQDVIDLFFHANTRHLFFAKAKKRFYMPGKIFKDEKEVSRRGRRMIPANKIMTVCIDRVLGTANVELNLQKNAYIYKMSIPEFESLADKLEEL